MFPLLSAVQVTSGMLAIRDRYFSSLSLRSVVLSFISEDIALKLSDRSPISSPSLAVTLKSYSPDAIFKEADDRAASLDIMFL